MAKSKEVVKKEEAEGGMMAVSDQRPDFMKDTDRGSEGVSMDDLTIPRIAIIQDLSPQHKKNKPEYIEGAEVGMLFNTVTGNLYEAGLMFVPAYFIKEWVIWKNQAAGGGFCGAFASEAEAKAAWGQNDYEGETVKVNGVDVPMYEIVDTGQHYGLVVDGDHIEEVVISMSKSQMKVSRKLNSMVKLAGGDRFSRGYRIEAVEDQNAAGQDFWNYGLQQLGYVTEPVYLAGEKLYEAISSGDRKINYGADTGSGSSDAEDKEDRDY